LYIVGRNVRYSNSEKVQQFLLEWNTQYKSTQNFTVHHLLQGKKTLIPFYDWMAEQMWYIHTTQWVLSSRKEWTTSTTMEVNLLSSWWVEKAIPQKFHLYNSNDTNTCMCMYTCIVQKTD
jgi:hypothetical protein